MQTLPLPQEEIILTVSQLNREARSLLEEKFPFVWVEGEISNFAAPHSGHWYFSLKDAQAQVRCAMFRMHQRKLGFMPKDGMLVLIKARVSLYENRGEFQLIAEQLEERGEGKLQRAFEAMKKKLHTAGLFALEHKKALPFHPKTIGVITSATGAAIRDILNVLRRRYPCANVIIYPSLVQGGTAAPTIVGAIELANQRSECEVLILARGGGSLEDLWAFNEESVAHAIYRSRLPIITGIGHEVDFTIADFVADKRAPTPSAAAEIVTPDMQELTNTLFQQRLQLIRLAKQRLQAVTQHIAWTLKHLSQQHPKQRLQQKMQHLDFCEHKFSQLIMSIIYKTQISLRNIQSRLIERSPQGTIKTLQNFLAEKKNRIHSVFDKDRVAQQAILASFAAQLNTLSPLATLKRGYAIVSNQQKDVIRSSHQVQAQDRLNVRLQDGCLVCEVLGVEETEK